VIVGTVNASREAIVRIRVQAPGGLAEGIAAIVDTGFNGWLILPSPLVTTLNLSFRGRGDATLADGGETLFDIHEATVVWEGQPRLVPVYAVESGPSSAWTSSTGAN
jgi:clan AA aspartic protease